MHTEYERETINLLVALFLGDVSQHAELMYRYKMVPIRLWMLLIEVAKSRAVAVKQYVALEETLLEKGFSNDEILIICQKIIVIE